LATAGGRLRSVEFGFGNTQSVNSHSLLQGPRSNFPGCISFFTQKSPVSASRSLEENWDQNAERCAHVYGLEIIIDLGDTSQMKFKTEF
jgi:hypothetical protein